MNKKGLLPLIFLIPLILIGLIVGYLIIKAVVGLIATAIFWTIGLAFIIALVYILYMLFKWAVSPKKRKRK